MALSINAVRPQKRVVAEYSNCRKFQKCTDFTQIYPFLALLRSLATIPKYRIERSFIRQGSAYWCMHISDRG